jgi:signal transduction histidine kinase
VIAESKGPPKGLTRRFLSVPIRLKILGIGLLVATIFGLLVLLLVRDHFGRSFREGLVSEARWSTHVLATRLEEHLITRDRLAIHDVVDEFVEAHPGIGYVSVWNSERKRVLSTGTETPLLPENLGGPEHCVVLELPSGEGEVYECSHPVLDGHAGYVTLGLTDIRLKSGLADVTETLLAALAICFLLGQALALILTYLLSRPISELVRAVKLVGAGDLNTRATTFYNDEIGELAEEFNRMVERLSSQQSELAKTEQERLGLLDKVISSQEEERARIARELHDELGQSLSALHLEVRANAPDAAIECIGHRAKVSARIQRIIEEVQSFAWSLRPSILDDYGLEPALTRHIESVTKHSKIAFDFQSVTAEGAPRRLAGRFEVVLYRVAQEAITNVLRHSNASGAEILLFRDLHHVRLLVEDDGQGFSLPDIDMKESRDHLGLIGMRERVVMLGGDFAIETGDGEGTTVRAVIPLPEVDS